MEINVGNSFSSKQTLSFLFFFLRTFGDQMRRLLLFPSEIFTGEAVECRSGVNGERLSSNGEERNELRNSFSPNTVVFFVQQACQSKSVSARANLQFKNNKTLLSVSPPMKRVVQLSSIFFKKKGSQKALVCTQTVLTSFKEGMENKACWEDVSNHTHLGDTFLPVHGAQVTMGFPSQNQPFEMNLEASVSSSPGG